MRCHNSAMTQRSGVLTSFARRIPVLLGLLVLAALTVGRRPDRRWRDVLSKPLPFEVEWRVPVGCDFSGFFVEVALGFMPALARHDTASRSRFWLLTGECTEEFLRESLTHREATVYRALRRDEVQRTAEQTAASVAIEHGDPCAMRSWTASTRPLWVIARSMSEGDLPEEQASCLKDGHADEVWVPTAWHVNRFIKAGVPAAKLRVIAEPVDTDFFSPPAEGRKTRADGEPFVFLSSFKWERRKGWDLLLQVGSVAAGSVAFALRSSPLGKCRQSPLQ